MTSRQIGRRMAGVAAQRRRACRKGGKRIMPIHRKLNTRRQETTPTAKERRRWAQSFFCAAVFVLLVAIKLLFPQGISVFREKAVTLMQQNIDVKAVFSAVGRAFTEEKDYNTLMEEVYEAVFHAEEKETLKKTAVKREGSSCALRLLHTYYQVPEQAQQTHEDIVQGIVYSEENIPADVSMEQAVLGFSYCTPLVGTLTSPFGYRDHPVEGEELFHYGVDLAANTGTTISAFAAGTMKAVGESSSYGKYCIIQHENGYSTLYAHCSKISVSSGSDVKMGQKIAEVGKTGMATGSHLHFELMQKGTYLNPIYYVSVA